MRCALRRLGPGRTTDGRRGAGGIVPPTHRNRTGSRRALMALVAVTGTVVLAGCQSSGTAAQPGAAGTAPASSSSAPARPTGPKKGSGTPVHVRMFEGDGQTYGAG